MGCRCAERREALAKAMTALRHRDMGKVKSAAAFVASSSIEDVTKAAKRAASHARLRRR